MQPAAGDAVHMTQAPLPSQTPVIPLQGAPAAVGCVPQTWFVHVAITHVEPPEQSDADMQPPLLLLELLELLEELGPPPIPLVELELDDELLVVGMPPPPPLEVVVETAEEALVGPVAVLGPNPVVSRKQPAGAAAIAIATAATVPAPRNRPADPRRRFEPVPFMEAMSFSCSTRTGSGGAATVLSGLAQCRRFFGSRKARGSPLTLQRAPTPDAGSYKLVGLTHAVTDSSYDTIDFGLYALGNGTIEIWEDGVPVNGQQTFSVQVSGGVVTYLQNGMLLYKSTRSPTFPLVFDAALYTPGVRVNNVSLVSAPIWQNIVGVNALGHDITKTSAAGWNAGASTVASLSGNGYASFTTGETTTYKLAGLTQRCWGNGYLSSTGSLPVPGLTSGVETLSGTCAVMAGNVYCWSSNPSSPSPPAQVPGLSGL
jgi:hypothetical protein